MRHDQSVPQQGAKGSGRPVAAPGGSACTGLLLLRRADKDSSRDCAAEVRSTEDAFVRTLSSSDEQAGMLERTIFLLPAWSPEVTMPEEYASIELPIMD